MIPSPLHAQHQAAGAQLGPWEQGEIPLVYRDLDADLAALRQGCGLIDLSCKPLLRLQGPDARRFTNAMFTNNLRDLPVGSGAHNALTDNKGRLQGLADTWLVAEDTVWAVIEGMEREAAFERLDNYIIMDPVELSDESEAWALLSLQGPQAQALSAALGAPEPKTAVTAWGEGWLLRNDRCGHGGLDVLLPREGALALWQAALAAGASPCGVRALDALRLQQGIPRWPVDAGERSFVHELGLRGRVCSFSKGCYIGQEVINRMDTMGKINKKLVGLVAQRPGI